jgi:hypothetical protein
MLVVIRLKTWTACVAGRVPMTASFRPHSISLLPREFWRSVAGHAGVILRNRGNQDMEQVLQLVVVFFAALATGGLMVNRIGLGRAMSRLSASTYVEFHQATNHTFDPYIPIVVVGAFATYRSHLIPSLSAGITSLCLIGSSWVWSVGSVI